MPDLYDEPLERRERPKVVAEYPYTDEQGEVLYVVRRLEPGYDGERKTFRQFRPDGSPGVKGIRRVLYRLPEVLAEAKAGGTIFVVEGEKDADNLAKIGAVATCNVTGAGKWHDDYVRCLRGAGEVVVICDRDDPGRKHAAQVVESVERAGIPVRALEPAKGKDVSDHLAAGLGYDELVPMDPRPTNPKNEGSARIPGPRNDSGISGTQNQGAGWDDPVPLDMRTLPPFPVDSLGPLAQFVRATAEALQVPNDMVAFACLATISTTTGGRRKVQVKHNWTESTALYLTCLADSSEKKTPALNAAADPLRAIETELIEQARPAVEETAQEIRITTAAMDKAEKAAGGSGDKDARDKAQAEAEGARLKLLELGDTPSLPVILVRDITLEALALRMAEQKGRLGSLASEGGLFKIAAGLYGNNGKANTDLLLEGYTGGPYSIERVGRQDRRMGSTFLALGMIVQPGMVAGLEKKNPEFRQSGFLGRFLYAKPAPTDYDTFETPEVPDEVVEDYERRIRDLVEKVWNTSDVVVMNLSNEARTEFGAFYDRFGQRRKPGGDLHDIADWAGKLRGQLIRIAACITLYENPYATEISLERVRAAIAMGPYLIAHARAVFDLMGKNREGALKPLRDVIEWLRSRVNPGLDFSAREAWQALKGREWAEDMEVMNDVLAELEKAGWIALLPPPDTQGKRGRKPSPRFEVHPWVATPPQPQEVSGGSHPANPNNQAVSHLPTPDSDSGISGTHSEPERRAS
jgi:5S rRNA maturation endonuclease (ribonuclease M5)